MTRKNVENFQLNTDQIAAENCCVEQVMNSIFEHVAGDAQHSIEHRSDHQQIVQFSNSLLENEFIFGSASEEILESVQQKLAGKAKQQEIS